MIPYHRDLHQVTPSSSVKIIGLGGAGANMLERIALEGSEGTELVALNTDIRTLGSSKAAEKIQLGLNLTKGLGAGGDPELGHQAVLEAEDAVRQTIKGHQIVFLCVGLGGGTGSGAAPIVTRIAREEGAFVVVFASMPFAFEGKRRRDQAETALNELAVLSNALVTFDNNRMGELVLAQQGIHEAFVAADQMISESIKAVIRLVIRPGLINVGLDDLMSALRTTRSRCLFGSGIAEGEDRALNALRNALASPLLDQGSLLREAQTVLVHLCGGENLTLFEIELLMQRLQMFVPENAHVLFGAAVDPAMGDKISVTLISALPEDSLSMAPRDAGEIKRPEPSQEVAKQSDQAPNPVLASLAFDPAPPLSSFPRTMATAPVPPIAEPAVSQETLAEAEEQPAPPASPSVMVAEFVAMAHDEPENIEQYLEAKPAPEPTVEPLFEEKLTELDEDDADAVPEKAPSPTESPKPEAAESSGLPPKRPQGKLPWSIDKEPKSPRVPDELDPPLLKLGIKNSTAQSELSLDSSPRGRFEGENPNVFEGEDLDLPPFLRKKK